MEFLRTLIDALKLALFVRPARPARRIGPGQFWLALGLVAVLFVLESWLDTDGPSRFYVGGITGVAFTGLLALAVSYLAARALGRSALFWPLATMLALLGSGLYLAARGLAALLPEGLPQPPALPIAYVLWCAWLLLAVRRALDWLEPYRRWPARTIAALAIAAALVLPTLWIFRAPFFVPDFEDETYADAAAEPAFEPEVVMAEQYRLVDEALAALAAQRPGRVDLYLVAFAGDGGESVFANEVRYARDVFEQRYDAKGRTLLLVNDPDTTDAAPLATLTNLRRALAGIGARIDRSEDIVAVFLTSHGSEDHELYVALDPLPLAQVTPDALALAFADAGIDWRVAMVSACYSGGFVDGLAGPRTLVMSAARRDRTSFGCGADSDITYFGRAFLAHGLNRRDTLVDAFDYAKREIAKRERDEGKTPSEPQIASSPEIVAQLARWREGIALGGRVRFRGGSAGDASVGR